MVDVGTNAEIVLGNRHGSCRVEPDRAGVRGRADQLRPARKGGTGRDRARPDRPDDARAARQGRGLRRSVRRASAFRDVRVTGVCGSGIVEVVAELYLAGVLMSDGTIDGALASRTPHVVPEGRTFSYVLWEEPELRITQNDVRRSSREGRPRKLPGWRRMGRHGRRQRLSQALGARVDLGNNAPSSGSSPTASRTASRLPGTPPGTGAGIALLITEGSAEIERVVRSVEKVETAVEPRFQEHFVHAMAIPHDTDPYARLAEKHPAPCRASRPPAGRRRRTRATERGRHDRDLVAGEAEGAQHDRRHGCTHTSSTSCS